MARAIPWVVLTLMLFAPSTGAGQIIRPDSAGHPPAGDSSLTAGTQDTSGITTVQGKSPGLAMLFSAVLPGAGQVYNESYWKTPIVLGLGIYFVSEWLDNNRRTEDYRGKYAGSVLAGAADDRYLRLREFYKEQRDSFAWYFLILYVINIADAYVDASLYGFDVSPTLGLRGLPAAGLVLRYNW